MPSSHDTLVTCKKCQAKTPVRDMKYDMNGKDLICGRCYEVRVASVKKPSGASQYADPKKFKLEFTDPLDGKTEVKYICTKCKFKFRRKKEFGEPKTCPYCSKATVITEGSTSASQLLKDATQGEYDY